LILREARAKFRYADRPPDLKLLEASDTYLYFKLKREFGSRRQGVTARPKKSPDVISIPS
jgi:hypothetical protein